VVAEARGGTGGARHRRLTGRQINGNSDGRPPIELEVPGWRRRWRGDSGELLQCIEVVEGRGGSDWPDSDAASL
jgi:hypothetical protein